MTDKFIQALLNGDFETASSMVSGGASVDNAYGETGWTPLHFMAENRALESARWLLPHGADPNKADVSGWTPLHLAIDAEGDCAGQEYVRTGVLSMSGEMVRLLLAHGADANALTRNGKTPLRIAIFYRHTAAADILREYGGHE